MNQQRPAIWLIVLMGVSFALMWSSAFSVAKILVTQIPPFTVSAIRFAVAALLAALVAHALGQKIPRGRRVWIQIIILGLCQNTFYLGLYFAALTRIDAGLAAIAASTMPLIVAAMAPFLTREPLAGATLFGLITGFIGVVWIMASRVAGGVDLTGMVLVALGVLALSFATITIKRVNFGTDLLMVVACQMLVGSLGCLPVALLLETVGSVEITPVLIGAFAYQVLVPGIIATLIWFWLVKRISTAGASSFHFLNPVFGVGFAWLLLDERVSSADMIGVVLVAVGIAIVNKRHHENREMHDVVKLTDRR